MKKKTGMILFMMALLTSIIWCSPLQAAVIPGLTGIEDGGAYNESSKIINAVEEGKYTMTLGDRSGGNHTITFWIDRTAPVVDGVVEGGIYNNERQITISDGTNGSGVVSVTLNGEPKPTTGFSESIEGEYTLVAIDKAGNNKTVNFRIDKTKPIITNFTVSHRREDDGHFLLEIYELTATGTDNGIPFTAGPNDTLIKKLDRTPIDNYFEISEDNWGEIIYTPDEFGMYRVYIKDKAGNISDDCLFVSWTGSLGPVIKDNELPKISIDPPNPLNARVNDIVSYKVKYSDDVKLDRITLSAADVTIKTSGTAVGALLPIEGTGNERTVKVKVVSGTGSIWIELNKDTAYDVAGKSTLAAISTAFAVEEPIFSLGPVTITSTNDNTKYAKVNDVITLDFTSNIDLTVNPTVKISGNAASVNGSGKSWRATYTVSASTPEGLAAIQIICKDRFGNVLPTITSTTDGSTVTVDRSAPKSPDVEDGKAYNYDKIITFSDTAGIKSAQLKKNEDNPQDIVSGITLADGADYVLTLTDILDQTRIYRFKIDKIKPVYSNFTVSHSRVDDGYSLTDEYVIMATGTDIGSGLAGGAANAVVIRKSDGMKIDNYFGVSEDNWGEITYAPEFGVYRIYIQDKANNISDNYVSINWTGAASSLVPYIEQ